MEIPQLDCRSYNRSLRRYEKKNILSYSPIRSGRTTAETRVPAVIYALQRYKKASRGMQSYALPGLRCWGGLCAAEAVNWCSKLVGGGALTWYLWNSDLLTAVAITPFAKWLYFYDIIFIKRKGKLHRCFVCFYNGRTALFVPSV